MEDLVVELERSMASIEEVAHGSDLADRLAAHRARIAALRSALLDEASTDGDSGAASIDMRAAVRAYKRGLVERALAASPGDNSAAARRLGVHPKYLYQLIRELEAAPAPPSTSGRRSG